MCPAPCYDAREVRSHSGDFVGRARPTRKTTMRAQTMMIGHDFYHRYCFLKGIYLHYQLTKRWE